MNFAQLIARGFALLTGAQRTATVTGVLGETSAGAVVNGAGATVLTKSGTTTTFPGDTTSSGLLRASLGGFVGGIGVGWNSPNTLTVPSGGRLDFGSSGINSPDLIVLRGAANTLEQRNGANAQRSRIFNSGDNTNGEWFDIDWQTLPNTARVGTRAAGTGTARNLEIVSASALTLGAGGSPGALVLDAPGTSRFYPSSDNVMDLGVSSRRWLNIWVSGALKFGATSAEPMLARSGTAMRARLGDDSAFADLQARSLIANSVSRVIPVPVGSLPSASASGAGAEATVNDATSPAWGAPVAGGGAVTVGVRSDGTNWIVF